MKTWDFETSASALLAALEVEDVGAWRLQIVSAVDLPVGVEVEVVGASYSEDVAERSRDAEVEDVVALHSETASVVRLLEGVEAVDVEAFCLGDAIERLEDIEAEEGAVELAEDAEAEEDAAEYSEDFEHEEDVVDRPEDAGIEDAAVLHLEAFAVETFVVVEVTQVFELAFGSSGWFPDLDLVFYLEDSYSLLGPENSVADCGLGVASEVLEHDEEARPLRADFHVSQEVG